MTTTTPSAGTVAAPGGPPRVAPATQLVRVVAAEWTKLRSVRSTLWTLASTVLVSIGLPALISLAVINSAKAPGNDFDAAGFSMVGLFLAQLIVGSLGVLVVCGEYSTGTIRASLSAIPQRLMLMVGKTLTFALVLLVMALVTCFAAFFLTQAILSTKSYGVTLSHSGSLQVVVGGALYLVAVGLLGVGLGFVMRHTAAAISTVFGLLFVLPIVANFLPQSWQDHVVKYLPGQAGQAVFATRPQPHTMAPWTGLTLFFGYALLSLVIGGVMLRRRDA
jgi:ABC-2 type transport system permease protein